jgi:hypothetical protein
MSTAKHIRDVYQLRQSILHFQLIRVDQNNVAFPTDCFCQTGILYELEGIYSDCINKRFVFFLFFQPMNNNSGREGCAGGDGCDQNTKFRSKITKNKPKISSKSKSGRPGRTIMDPLLAKIGETNHTDK